MAKVVIVGYGKMLYSLIKGIENSSHQILGVFRVDRTRYNPLSLFIKDIFNPSKDYTVIKYEKLHEIKANSVNSKKFINEIKKLNPDLIIVGSWGEKFKKEILKTVPCINFHPALLPKNRGANPYFWSIYNKQSVSGLTIHFMDEFFDRGDIIMQEAITIDENETGLSLKNKTVKLAKVMIKDFLDLYDKKQLQPVKQDEKFASYEPQLKPENSIINLNLPKSDVYCHLRALYPWASPYVRAFNRYVKIEKFEFLKLEDEHKTFENYDLIKDCKDYFILKGNDFLIKIFK